MFPDLRRILETSDVPALQRLHREGQLTAADLRAWDNAALREVCRLRYDNRLNLWTWRTTGCYHKVRNTFALLECMRSLGLNAEDVTACNNYALCGAARTGDAKMLRVLHRLFGLEWRRGAPVPNPGYQALSQNLLQLVCGTGSLAALRALVRLRQITSHDVSQASALRSARAFKRHKIVKYLFAHFNFSASDVHDFLIAIIRYDEPKLLPFTAVLEPNDVRANSNCAFRTACTFGRLAAVKYLHETYQLTADDARAVLNSALRDACHNGHTDVVRYLRENIGLTTEDARAVDNYALWLSCDAGRLKVVLYLREGFGLGAEDARARDYRALRCAYIKQRYEIVQCLLGAYGLAADGFTFDESTQRLSCSNQKLAWK